MNQRKANYSKLKERIGKNRKEKETHKKKL